jgi:hypothetical protein
MFRRLFPFWNRRKEVIQPRDTAKDEGSSLGIVPRGQTSGDEQLSFAGVVSSLNETYAGFEERDRAEVIRLLRSITNTNPDIGSSIADRLALALSDVVIDFEGADQQTDRARKRLESIKDTIYREGGTLNNLTQHWGRELIETGAISYEAVPNKSRAGLAYIKTVPAEELEIKRNQEGRLEYYQSPYGIQLNPATYKYIPYATQGNSPYGIPALLPILFPLERLLNFTKAQERILNKMAAGAFYALGIPAPKATELGLGAGTESSPEYATKAGDLINTIANAYTNQAEKGFVAYFLSRGKDDVQPQFDIQALAKGAEGMPELENSLNRALWTAAQTEPFMRGKPDSTTQALAHVIIALRVETSKSIRTAIELALRFALDLELRLAGINARTTVSFNDVRISSVVLEQNQADKTLAEKHATMLNNLGKMALPTIASDLDIPLAELEEWFEEREEKKELERQEALNAKPQPTNAQKS